MGKDNNIKTVAFVFENCEYLDVPYDKFKYLNIDHEVNFRIEGFNLYGACRLTEHNDIVAIRTYDFNDNVIKEIYVAWEDGDQFDNSFQICNESNHHAGIYDISISERKYINSEINNLNRDIKNATERLEFMLQRLTNLD